MDYITNLIIPILIILGLYLIVKLSSKTRFNHVQAIKSRIILGSIGIGYFMSIAIQSGEWKTITLTVIFALLILYGILSLFKKYFDFMDEKKND